MGVNKKVKLVADNEISAAVASAVVKDKKEKKDKKDKKEKRARDDDEEEATEPVVGKKKRAKSDPSVEVDPFAVLETDPIGMTEDIKREVRIKTQGFATRLAQGKEKNLPKDLHLNTIHLDSYERIAKTLNPEQKSALNLAVVALKWKELSRHLQIFSVRPIAGITAEQAIAAKALAEKVSKQRRQAKYSQKYKKRMSNKLKSGNWDFSRPAKGQKAPQPKVQIDKSKIEATVVSAPLSAVAQRINMAKEAAKARMKLSSIADDEE